ncbi:hypothetical protein CEP51_006911 [Fusarium floridanum]|uniref:Tautomerase cis-CaaD-like domain-containing protein n=1 Tax=Fusarium floridanum TaxID=1325733 RepID=A0A428RR97_9HYPO|nr:hypothetical protein CEP51_006911 [Fusarium floridanum]
MPFYEIHHSYPLSDDERQSIARSITDLHCTAFKTPSFFVHIRFVARDINDRTRPHVSFPYQVEFDSLASDIEDAWYKALSTTRTEGTSHATEVQRLLMVTFVPMVTIREGGMAIPEAGQEGGWLKQQLPYIRMMSEQGLGDFTDLLGELQQRDDLRKMIQ